MRIVLGLRVIPVRQGELGAKQQQVLQDGMRRGQVDQGIQPVTKFRAGRLVR